MDMHMSRRGELTRRDFVKTSAAVVGGVGAGTLVAPTLAHAGTTGSIRVGLIGCGGRGTGAALQAMNADEGVVLTAMGDAFEDRVASSLQRLETHESERLASSPQGLETHAPDRIKVEPEQRFSGFDAYKQVIDSGVDVVILATPPVFRPAHLRYAIDAGKHVFCEKPVAVDAPGLRSVLESAQLAEERGLSLMSGFCWRYSMPQRETYGRIHDGIIGDVRAVQSTYNTGPLGDVAREPGWSDMEWQLRNWKAFTWASGDHIVEQAIHAIDWLSWAKQDVLPVRAFAVGGRQCRSGAWTGNMYDHFSVVYEYADGARGYHVCRQIANCTNDNSAYIIGTKGTCFVNPWGPTSIIEGERPWVFEGTANDMYQTEHDELFAGIRDGRPINDGVQMANSTMMGIMGRMCAYTGRTLTWEECLASNESLTPETWEWGDRAFPDVAMPGRQT
jgi:predicted dehydrogenase